MPSSLFYEPPTNVQIITIGNLCLTENPDIWIVKFYSHICQFLHTIHL